MRDSRDRRRWRTGAYLCGCVTLWIDCWFKRRLDEGVPLEWTMGKVTLYQARECLFAEYVVIGTLGRRSEGGRLRHQVAAHRCTLIPHPVPLIVFFATADCFPSQSHRESLRPALSIHCCYLS